MSTAWNGTTTVTISSTGNTLETMYTDVSDDTVVSKSLANGYPEYFVDGIKGRYITIAAGGTLTIGDESDFSYREALYHEWSGTNYQNQLTVTASGSLHIFGNVDVKLNYGCSATQYPQYAYAYGNLLFSGSDTYQPDIRGPRRWSIQAINTSDVDYMKKRYIIFNNIKAGETVVNPNFYLEFYNYIPQTMSFNNITMVNELYNGIQAPFSCFHFPPMLNLPVVNNLSASGSKINTRYIANAYIKYTNTIFSGSNTTYNITTGGSLRPTEFSYPTTAGSDTAENLKFYKLGQIFTNIFEDSDVSTTYNYHTYINSNAMGLYINFTNLANHQLLVYNNAQGFCWHSDTVFSRGQIDNYNSIVKKVYLLDLTVLDKNNNPIDDAYVDIRQTNTASLDVHGKYEVEKYWCRTDETGKIIATNQIGGALLSNQIRITSGETLYTVSSGSTGTYHEVKIYKYGYKEKTLNVEMDADKEITVQLEQEAPNFVNFKLQGN